MNGPLGGPVFLKSAKKYSDFRQTGDKHWGGGVSLNRKITFYREFDTFIILLLMQLDSLAPGGTLFL